MKLELNYSNFAFNKFYFSFSSFLTYKGFFLTRFHRKLMDERHLVKFAGYFLFKQLTSHYKKLVNPFRKFDRISKKLKIPSNLLILQNFQRKSLCF